MRAVAHWDRPAFGLADLGGDVSGHAMKADVIAVVLAAAVIALSAASAQAQGVGGTGGNGMGGGFGGRNHQRSNTSKTEPAKPKVDEKAYDAALKVLPDKKFDAWHGVR